MLWHYIKIILLKKKLIKKAADIEEQQRIENMPKFYIRLLSASGFCGSLGFTINNVSNNIAYDIEVYDLKIKKDLIQYGKVRMHIILLR